MASNALKALLGVLAVAGYQNRDKIGELLRYSHPCATWAEWTAASGGWWAG
jgi:hypothetical protein